VRLAWATDVHLNFLDRAGKARFAIALLEAAPDGVVLSGDIAEAPSLGADLTALATALARPIWFVLGNHDFYRGSIAGVHEAVRALVAGSPHLRWLPEAGVIPLDAETCLVGVDGWGDGRVGNAVGTRVMLNDFRYVAELTGLRREELLARLRALGDASAARAGHLLDEAVARFRRTVFVTHVPPFREACWHEGRVSDDEWLPWFACGAVGEVLRDRLARAPDHDLTVLCGHTHGAGVVEVLPNLRVHTGGAEYGAPEIAAIVGIEAGAVTVGA
jgi:hypothetical protein